MSPLCSDCACEACGGREEILRLHAFGAPLRMTIWSIVAAAPGSHMRGVRFAWTCEVGGFGVRFARTCDVRMRNTSGRATESAENVAAALGLHAKPSPLRSDCAQAGASSPLRSDCACGACGGQEEILRLRASRYAQDDMLSAGALPLADDMLGAGALPLADDIFSRAR